MAERDELRPVAGTGMLASSITHLSEWIFFDWSLPLLLSRRERGRS